MVIRMACGCLEKEIFQTSNSWENSCIDEITVPFKGQVYFKQYLKDKPHRWGVKIWALVTRSLDIHSKFRFTKGEGNQGSGTLGLAHRVVTYLVRNGRGKVGVYPKMHEYTPLEQPLSPAVDTA